MNYNTFTRKSDPFVEYPMVIMICIPEIYRITYIKYVWYGGIKKQLFFIKQTEFIVDLLNTVNF